MVFDLLAECFYLVLFVVKPTLFTGSMYPIVFMKSLGHLYVITD